jgi:hypothetical protein
LGKVAHYTHAREPFYPAILIIAEKNKNPSGHGSRHGSYALTQQHGLLLTHIDDLGKAIDECPTCQQQKRILSHQYVNVSQENKPATW